GFTLPTSIFNDRIPTLSSERPEIGLLYHPPLRRRAKEEKASPALSATSSECRYSRCARVVVCGAGWQIAHCYGKPLEQPLSQRPHLSVERQPVASTDCMTVSLAPIRDG